MKLVTIICESYALNPLKKLLKNLGAHGWTYFPVEGAGSHGEREGEMKEFSNIQFQVVIAPNIAEELLKSLERDFFESYGMIAFMTDVHVLRSHKF